MSFLLPWTGGWRFLRYFTIHLPKHIAPSLTLQSTRTTFVLEPNHVDNSSIITRTERATQDTTNPSFRRRQQPATQTPPQVSLPSSRGHWTVTGVRWIQFTHSNPIKYPSSCHSDAYRQLSQRSSMFAFWHSKFSYDIPALIPATCLAHRFLLDFINPKHMTYNETQSSSTPSFPPYLYFCFLCPNSLFHPNFLEETVREIKTKFQLERHRSDPHRWEDNIKKRDSGNKIRVVLHERSSLRTPQQRDCNYQLLKNDSVQLRELKRPSGQM